MKKTLVILGLSLLWLNLAGPSAYAQAIFDPGPSGDKPVGVGMDECRKAIVLELAKTQRKFRSVLYGYPKAELAPAATARFALDGSAWIKVDENAWRSVAPGFENTTWSDSQMDQRDEFISTEWPDGRRGYFRTRRVLTSELIPYLAQSARALQCEADTVCDLSLASLARTEATPQPAEVNTVGCVQRTLPTPPACHFAALAGNALPESDIRTFCSSTVDTLLEREADLLKLAVEYDAAYRSLLQFSGNFDLFLEEFRWPLTFTIRQAAGLIGQLGRIPCFLSSCEDLLPTSSSSSAAPSP